MNVLVLWATLGGNLVVAAPSELRSLSCSNATQCREIAENSLCLEGTCVWCSRGDKLVVFGFANWRCDHPREETARPRIARERFATPPRYNVFTVVIIVAILVVALLFVVSKWSLYFYFPCCTRHTFLPASEGTDRSRDPTDFRGIDGTASGFLVADNGRSDQPPSYAEAVLGTGLPTYREASFGTSK